MWQDGKWHSRPEMQKARPAFANRASKCFGGA
jgi:hypothetical protein